MSNSSNICRDLLDTRDTIKNQLMEILVINLVANKNITRDECKVLSTKMNHQIDEQVDSLIDRISNELK